MADSQSAQSLDELNKQVHELSYIEPGKKSLETKTTPDQKQGRELAKKIQENIQAYQHEINSQQRPHLQT